jgi:hypothetical protein
MIRNGFDHRKQKYDRLSFTIDWELGIDSETEQPKEVASVTRIVNAFNTEREPSRFYGESLGRCIGSAQFCRPLLVWAAAIIEVIDWDMIGPTMIDQDHVDDLHAACVAIVKAYDDLDRQNGVFADED